MPWSSFWSALLVVWSRLDDNPLLEFPFVDDDDETPVCSEVSSDDEPSE